MLVNNYSINNKDCKVMRILDVLISENFDFDDGDVTGFAAPKISVSDLNSLQLRTLNRVKTGQVDIETASDKELDIIMDLIELGLIDDDGNVTDAGNEAVEDDSQYRISPNTDVDTEFNDDYDEQDRIRTADTDSIPVGVDDDDDDEITDYVVK